MAAKFTYDLANKLIIINSGVTSIDAVIDLYSDWKEDVLADAQLAGMDEIFRVTGGDVTGPGRTVSAQVFLRNDLGWRIRGPEEDTEIEIVGNLRPEDTGTAVFVPTLGGYTVLFAIERSADAFDTPGEKTLQVLE